MRRQQMTKNVFDVRRSCASRGTVDPARAPPSITAVYSTSHSAAAAVEVCRTAASLAPRLHVVARVAASMGKSRRRVYITTEATAYRL